MSYRVQQDQKGKVKNRGGGMSIICKGGGKEKTIKMYNARLLPGDGESGFRQKSS